MRLGLKFEFFVYVHPDREEHYGKSSQNLEESFPNMREAEYGQERDDGSDGEDNFRFRHPIRSRSRSASSA